MVFGDGICAKGGGSDERLPAADLSQLRKLLENLPDDGSRCLQLIGEC